MLYSPNCLEWHLGDELSKTPQGTVWSCRVVGESFDSVQSLAAALAKSQDHRASCGVFSFGCYCSAKTKQRTMSRWPTRKGMRLLTSQRVNLLGVSQEQGKLGDGRIAYVKSALEIEPRPSGCSSPKRMAEVRVSPFLACPMSE
jgi:hypothetical protein